MTTQRVKITYNGNLVTIAQGITLVDFINEHVQVMPPFAAAVNGMFVPKESYDSTIINQGDVVEIVVPMQGG